MGPSAIKTGGYLVSTLSVLLLGLVAWKSAAEQPPLMALLIAGMAFSIIGMLLRWISYRMDK